jgi:hypothetical protein
MQEELGRSPRQRSNQDGGQGDDGGAGIEWRRIFPVPVVGAVAPVPAR